MQRVQVQSCVSTVNAYCNPDTIAHVHLEDGAVARLAEEHWVLQYGDHSGAAGEGPPNDRRAHDIVAGMLPSLGRARGITGQA